MLSRKQLILILSCAVIMPMGTTAAAQTLPAQAAPLAYHIAPGRLATVLTAIAARSGVALNIDRRAVRGKTSPGVDGVLSPAEALAQALQGTGLQAAPTGTGWSIPAIPIAGSRSRRVNPEKYSDDIVVTMTNLSATRTATALRDIPQSVSVVSSDQINKQNDRTLDDVLDNATGITRLQGGSNFNGFLSRGFTITSIHLDDGPQVGLMNNSAQPFHGLPDLSEYEQVEILRGADGLFGGNGNPGATVSLARKVPLADPRATISVQGGSWNQARAEFDVTGPIAFDGALKARLAAAYDRQDYFYSVANLRKWKVFSVLSYDIGTRAKILVGGSYQHLDTLPFDNGLPRYPDGTDLHLPRSTSLALPWNYYNTQSTELYAKLSYDINDNWRVKTGFTFLHDSNEAADATFVAPVLPQGNVLAAQPSLFFTEKPGKQNQLLADLTLTGTVKVFGLTFDVSLGGDYVKYYGSSLMGSIQGFGASNENIFTFDPSHFPDPRGSATALIANSNTHFTTINYGIYGSLRLHVTDRLALIGGARRNADDATSTTLSSGTFGGMTFVFPPTPPVRFEDHKVTPYGGATYRIDDHLSLYASYADIYITNSGNRQFDGELVPPSDGVNIEAGLKGAWFGGRLNANVSAFKINQNNIAFPDYAHLGSTVPGCCYVGGLNNKSKGIEVEVAGKVTRDWSISAGYTYNDNKLEIAGVSAGALSSLTPKHLFKFWTNYRLPGAFDRWDIGVSLKAQSENYYQTTYFSGRYCGAGSLHCPPDLTTVRTTQRGYAVADLRIGYKISENLQAAVSINNLFDLRYFSTVGIPQSSNSYGNPRNVLIKLQAAF